LLFPFTAPLLLAETAIKYNQGEGELSGTLKLGAWRYFGSFVPEAVGNNGLRIGLVGVPGEAAEKDYGFYAIIDQMVYRLPGPGDPRGVTLFGSYIVSPPEGNLIEKYFEIGATFNGLSDWRPRDTFGVGFIYTGVSSRVSEFYREIGDPIVPSFEGMLELSYTAQVMPGFTLQPDFQYFWNPGGHTRDPDDLRIAIPNAAVFGLRTTVNY
jgi:porin